MRALMIAVVLMGCDSHDPPSGGTLLAEPAQFPAITWFGELRAGHWATGYHQMSALYRDATSVEDFQHAIEANPLVARSTSASIASYGACGGHPSNGYCVNGSLLGPAGEVPFDLVFTGDKEILTLTVAHVPVVGVGVR
jgi:hypothetical protein